MIVCEDIRDEINNKKSLMGVLAGDILAPGFPAQLQIAIFFEYVPGSEDGDTVKIEFRLLQDDTEIAKGSIESPVLPAQTISAVLPRAIVVFPDKMTFRMLVTVNGRPEQEIMRKKVDALQPITS